MITGRLVEQHALSPGKTLDETIDMLFTLSSFESFDTLASSTRSMEEVAPLVYQLACAALALNNEAGDREGRQHKS